MGAQVPPPKHKIASGTSDTITPVSNSITKYRVGNALANEGVEVTIDEVYIENDAGEEIVGYRKTIMMDDDTDGTEDVTVKEYRLINGVLTVFLTNGV